MLLRKEQIKKISKFQFMRFPSGMTATLIELNPELIEWLAKRKIKIKTKKFDTELTKAKLTGVEKIHIQSLGFGLKENTHSLFLHSYDEEAIDDNTTLEIKFTKEQELEFRLVWLE